MTERLCLVHYHEIGLKGKNRSTFENQLVTNLHRALRAFEPSKRGAGRRHPARAGRRARLARLQVRP